ncbi:MAG: radical SAM protein [Candidatus Omnitrophota bacterium]|nr:MAG: radical SAM protein [Candidatus Omnitrophota bacterium]
MDKFKYIYGPVPSWRLGRSLGIDLLSSQSKICNFDCVYCQLGRYKPCAYKRQVYVPTEEIIRELNLISSNTRIDYITFSGTGEATLAGNLAQTILAVKDFRKEPVAVLTNAGLINSAEIISDLCLADFVIAKLDACSQNAMVEINHPAEQVKFRDILHGLKKFRSIYKGKMALQIMFLPQNKANAAKIAELAKDIEPDEIQINTPLRPCACSPLSETEIKEIKKIFTGLNVISVYEKPVTPVQPISGPDTLKRRGKIY